MNPRAARVPEREVVSPLEEKPTDEKTFEQYREGLKQEGMRLACFIRVFRLLHERRSDRLDELNIAPSFFQTVTDALFSAIVLWIDKLFAQDSQRGRTTFSSSWNITERSSRLRLSSIDAACRTAIGRLNARNRSNMELSKATVKRSPTSGRSRVSGSGATSFTRISTSTFFRPQPDRRRSAPHVVRSR